MSNERNTPCAHERSGTPRVHDLKIWPEQYRAVDEGRKTFEFRFDDRGFDVGDILALREWDPVRNFTGREIHRVVTYIARGQFGIPDGYVAMSIAEVPRG